MSLDSCLAPLLNEGKISQDLHDQALGLFADLRQEFRRQFGDQAADAMASDAALKALEGELARKRFLAGQTLATRKRIEADLAGFNGGRGSDGNGGGPIDPRGAPALFDGDDRASYSNVEGRRRAIRGRAHAMIDGILAKHSTNIIGQVRKKAELRDIVRELFGEDSGNPNARELADAWTQAAEMLRQRFNAAGGAIGKLERWGLPQSHDAKAVRAAGFDAWRAEVLPRLDRGRMIDQRTSLPFSDQALEQVLRDVWETIRSEGWIGRDVGAQGRSALANQRGDARFLQFKSADDWMAYAERFGANNAFDAMIGHIDGMARDIALLEILGPNPNATVDWLKKSLVQSAQVDKSPDTKAVDRAKAATKQIDRLYDEITGAAMEPENRGLALGFSAYRAWKTSASLGGAMLSAVTDPAFQFTTRLLNGIPAMNTLGNYLKLFRPGSVEDQKLAVRLGLIAEEWASRTAGQNRYLGEELTGEVSRRLADGVLRASGLSRWTQAGRWAFGMEFLGAITDNRTKAFGELEPAFRGMFERYGLTAADWDAIRATPVELDRGIEWIKPANIADRELGDRLLEAIARETDFAVPVADLRTRALVNSVAPRGTVPGEIVRSGFQFKSFGISILLQHGHRAMVMAGPQRAQYVATLFISTAIMGALAIQLKDLAAGRDPRKMDPAFALQAIYQGGGLGIYGDFVKSAENRLGGGIAGSIAGPMVADAQDVYNIATSKNPRGALFKEVKSQLPGNNLWYTRLAFDRLVADQLQEMADPQYRKSWAQMRKWSREQGTQYWWAPGQTAPSRAPDLSNATDNLEGVSDQ